MRKIRRLDVRDRTSLIRTTGHVPHWELEGSEYVITYRLADSLPVAVLHELAQERERLLKQFDAGEEEPGWEVRFKVNELIGIRFDDYLRRGFGSCALRDPTNAAVVLENLRFHDARRYVLDTWCIMPNHVHVLIRPLGFPSLAGILHSWKSFTAKKINAASGRTGTFWQKDYFDRIIRNEEHRDTVRRYILENPVDAGLRDWPWCARM